MITNKSNNKYFEVAKNWSDDMYAASLAARNRYRCAFYGVLALSFLLTVGILQLIPLQHTALVVVHHYNDGTVWVEHVARKHMRKNKAQIVSDLVRYVVKRESYSKDSYPENYSLVILLSNNGVAEQYAAEQNINSSHSPINTLGDHGHRKVHVNNVTFLDRARSSKNTKNRKHVNLAEINR